jgi:Zn-dependent M28 family amino/carboxypeptidase
MKKSIFILVAFIIFKPSFAGNYIFNEETSKAVSLIDKNQWFLEVEQLAAFNRYYKGEEIIRARDFITGIFNEIGLQTRLEEININNIKGHNIIGEIIGSEKPEEIYIVGAHYDSISEKPYRAAPGAEDNASGTAGLFALARALRENPPKATVRFVAFSGEEAGLFGSIQHVKNIVDAHDKHKVRGVLIMDMIAFSQDDILDILIETSSANEELIALLTASAQKYSTARISSTFNYWGSDHEPFINNGFNAALVIEKDYENYPHYHRSTDVPQNLNKNMAHELLKTLAGALGFWVY